MELKSFFLYFMLFQSKFILFQVTKFHGFSFNIFLENM